MARMRSRNRRGVLGLRNVKWRLLARLQMVEPRKGCAGTLGLGERNHFCARQYRATAIVTLVRHSCADVPHGGPYFAQCVTPAMAANVADQLVDCWLLNCCSEKAIKSPAHRRRWRAGFAAQSWEVQGACFIEVVRTGRGCIRRRWGSGR